MNQPPPLLWQLIVARAQLPLRRRPAVAMFALAGRCQESAAPAIVAPARRGAFQVRQVAVTPGLGENAQHVSPACGGAGESVNRKREFARGYLTYGTGRLQ